MSRVQSAQHTMFVRKFLICLLVCVAASGRANLVQNGGFESGLTGWRPLWTRESGVGRVSLDRRVVHSGTCAARIEHEGTEDWSFEPETRIPVQTGDVFEVEVWDQLQGPGSLTLCASTWDARGSNVSWTLGERTASAHEGWTRLTTRFVVPAGVSQIQPRLIGYRKATIWVDDFSLVKLSVPQAAKRPNLPAQLALTNLHLSVAVDTADATMTVEDHRTGRRWRQRGVESGLIVTDARLRTGRVELDLSHVPSGLELKAILELDPTLPEFSLKLDGAGELPGTLRYPCPFVSTARDRLIVPMNEGISYPVEDQSIEPFRLIAYGGHGICMAFWGVTDERQGYCAIIETPDDAAIQLQRLDGLLAIGPEWDSQLGRLGYTRKLRYVFIDDGGYVAIAKRYREYARQIGRLKTLPEKSRENPNIDLLVGAVNVWNWDSEPVELAREMQAAGIQRILWSRGGSPEALRSLNSLKVLTSRYDIYQDVMNPGNFPFLNGVDACWTTAAWPNDIIRKANGDWQRGWAVEGKGGKWYDCAVLCDRRALEYARARIPAELATHPYACRFIDTTTASPWNQCFNTNHLMTRTESREWKMKLLGYVSSDCKLVAGSETGHDAAVPYVDYFEGMLSLGPYRVPDAGRNMQRILDQVPERVAKFQVGQGYRLPLWELVYHDCVVAQWYWGDYNNKLPSLWDKRDLFNLLYGTPPMFMFDRNLWHSQKERIAQSYRHTCPYVRATGYTEMTNHRILSPDRNVQQTAFANGVTITVNFGQASWNLRSGETLSPGGFLVTGMPK
ncbi:exported hypothetical protein [Verrucomicrobia bacterium]|nr:exported hypothetical protein [Verrucomicrobiota bacterium]